MDGTLTVSNRCLCLFFDMLAGLFNHVEATGEWPPHLMTGLISLIPKTDTSTDPADRRPIIVMPLLYRLWAGTRLADILQWQETWAPAGMHGFRPRHGPDGLWMQIALEIEHVLLVKGRPASELDPEPAPSLRGLAFFGYIKCYDRAPHLMTLNIAEASGMDPKLLRPLRSVCKKLRRRFKTAGGVGPEFVSTTGLLQGFPLSVLLLNLLQSVWANALNAEEPRVKCPFFAGGAYACTEHGDHALARARVITKRFVELTGQELSATKTHLWAVNLTKEQKASLAAMIRINDRTLESPSHARFVGAQMAFSRQFACPLQTQRLQAAIPAAVAVDTLPLGLPEKCHMLAGGAVPKASYGVETHDLPQALFDRFRNACSRAFWGAARSIRAPRILFTLFAGPRTDLKKLRRSSRRARCVVSGTGVRTSNLLFGMVRIYSMRVAGHSVPVQSPCFTPLSLGTA